MTYSTNDARVYIGRVHWQFAVTMANIPHEYTIRHWHRELDSEFLTFATLIRTTGVVEPWPLERPKYHMHYLVVDNNKYWAMGPPWGDSGALEDLTIINRQRHPHPEAMLNDIDPAIIAGSRR